MHTSCGSAGTVLLCPSILFYYMQQVESLLLANMQHHHTFTTLSRYLFSVYGSLSLHSSPFKFPPHHPPNAVRRSFFHRAAFYVYKIGVISPNSETCPCPLFLLQLLCRVTVLQERAVRIQSKILNQEPHACIVMGLKPYFYLTTPPPSAWFQKRRGDANARNSVSTSLMLPVTGSYH